MCIIITLYQIFEDSWALIVCLGSPCAGITLEGECQCEASLQPFMDVKTPRGSGYSGNIRAVFYTHFLFICIGFFSTSDNLHITNNVLRRKAEMRRHNLHCIRMIDVLFVSRVFQSARLTWFWWSVQESIKVFAFLKIKFCLELWAIKCCERLHVTE